MMIKYRPVSGFVGPKDDLPGKGGRSWALRDGSRCGSEDKDYIFIGSINVTYSCRNLIQEGVGEIPDTTSTVWLGQVGDSSPCLE